MWHDIRFAIRQLYAAKGFTATAALTLALGIGGATGIFTLMHAVMLKSLPVADPERILRVGDGNNCCVLGGYQGRFSVYSFALYNYLRDHTPEFEELAAFQSGTGEVGVRRSGASSPEPLVDQFVSGSYFPLFGLRPYAGRLLKPADDQRGAPPVAVMSYRAWQQHYGGDPGVVGDTFIIEGSPFTVVGVAPPGFYGAALRPAPPDFWIPLAAEPSTHGRTALLDQSTSHWLYVFARMKPHTAVAPLEAKVNAELQQWLAANQPPASDRERRAAAKQYIALVPGGAGIAEMRDQYDRDLRLLLGITALVLLIACANLANLQLARGAAAASQLSIRVALGAPRRRLMRQVLVESTVLAVLGGALGLLVATETAELLIRLAFAGAPVPINTAPSLPVLAFAFVLSLATGILFGMAPAWSASHADPAAALHGAGRSAAGRSTLPQKTLVVLQAALSLVLLAGAGLMVQTLHNLTDQQWGFRIDNTSVASLHAGVSQYPPEKLQTIYTEMDRQLRQIPGVRSVALALYSPMSGDNWQMNATLESNPSAQLSPSWDRVSASFFDTIGARILRGRGFDERDTSAAPQVAIINQAFADQYMPNQDPIGKRFGLGGASHRADYTIVGIVNTIRFRHPRSPGRPMFFVPLMQMRPEEWKDPTLARSNVIESILLQTDGRIAGLAARIRQTVGGIDPNVTLIRVVSTHDMLDELLGHERLIGVLAQVFGILALLLASIGLYGLTAYSVARRTAEIGVRAALGATRGDVVRMVLRSALMQAGLGLAAGIPAALAAERLLAGQVYGVKTTDPWILATAAAVLAIAAAVAGLIPAMRAGSIDPASALRVDN